MWYNHRRGGNYHDYKTDALLARDVGSHKVITMAPGLANTLTRTLPLVLILSTLTACGNVITPELSTTTLVEDTLSPAGPATQLRPTDMMSLSTPVTTATPTVTPTPIVHVVQSGDTLLGIALDYGVDVETLQQLNGIQDPQALQVGQELTIPTGKEAAEEAPGLLLPTPTPLPFGVRGVAFYETPVGSLRCLGEVVNTTDVTLTNVQVRVTLFSETGEPAAEADVFVIADLIPPGGRAPFSLLFTSPPATWASPQVTVIRGEAAGMLTDSYVPIAVIEAAGQPAGPQFQVSGVVRNDSAELPAGSVSVIVTTYDDQGSVTGARQFQVELDGALVPGATAPFSLLFSSHGDTPADFNIVALGRIPRE
jgi:LysM repeat protein